MSATPMGDSLRPTENHRSDADVSSALELAKLSSSDMQPPAQTIFFHPENNDDMLLIEVDPHLLEHAKTESKEGGLVIRGDPDDELVLCTDSRTYLVREAGISNSLLVVPDLLVATKDHPLRDQTSDEGVKRRQVLKTFHIYWEPKQIRPSARKLYRLLKLREFRGVELEFDIAPSSIFSRAKLHEQIQASDDELNDMLQSLPVVELDGHFRLLEFGYEFRVLEFILTSIETNSMPLDKIETDVVINEVSELEPREIVESVVSWYVKDGALLKAKVSRTQAEALLRSGESFNLEQFLVTWRQSLIEGLDTNLSDLYGIAYVDDDKPRPTIHYLSTWDLPEAESARFDTLLRMKSSWKLEELEPYVRDLSLKGVNSLLLKYARSFRKNGQVFYSKK